MSVLFPRVTFLRRHALPTHPFHRASTRRALSEFPSQPPTSRVNRFRARLHAYNARFPRLLQRWTTPLIDAPASQIISFAILHEVTAIVPLVGLTLIFHYTNWLPAPAEWKWARIGVERAGKWARKRGWISDEEVKDAKHEMAAEEAKEGKGKGKGKKKWLWSKEGRSQVLKRGEEGAQWLLE